VIEPIAEAAINRSINVILLSPAWSYAAAACG
jgi:hypothetical protein